MMSRNYVRPELVRYDCSSEQPCKSGNWVHVHQLTCCTMFCAFEGTSIIEYPWTVIQIHILWGTSFYFILDYVNLFSIKVYSVHAKYAHEYDDEELGFVY